MTIEEDDLDKVVNLINDAWIKSVESLITDKELLARVRASAGLNIMRGFLAFAEDELEKELGLSAGSKPEPKPGLTLEEVQKLKDLYRKDNG